MNKKIAAILLSWAMMLSFIVIILEITPVVKAPIILFVDDESGTGPDNPPENFLKIQDAINASSDGYIIYVYNGTYYENVIVNKTLTLIGENKNTTIVDGGWADDPIYVLSDGVNITGFTVTHSGVNWYDAGINLESVEDCRIVDNIAVENARGFLLYYSNRTTLSGNTAVDNWDYGFFIDYSNNNSITGNNVTNSDSGIYLIYSNDNTVSRNIGWENGNGIRISDSRNITIELNMINSSWDHGIYLYYSDENQIADNIVSLSFDGIYLYHSTMSNITNNTFYSNYYRGLYLRDSNNITLHHNNIINNTAQVRLQNSKDIFWDDGMGEGNYWSDYTGLDDGSGGRTAGDGVGDTKIPHPFTDQGNGYYQLDNYPLVDPVGNYIFLYEGWNLVSFPFIQSDTNLGNVLSSIKGSYTAVQQYNASDSNDPWKHNCSLKPPYMNDLYNIDHLMGFWIYITKFGGVLFEYFGVEPATNQTITLYEGWNMVGYPSLTSYNRTDGLNNLTFGTHVDSVWTYDARAQKLKELGPSDHFKVGYGYWIRAKDECGWEVPL
ncbi:MAG: right-handed parallel beta-helix repeat-containing protein [Methanomassiliicoccales archaeon]|nr:MAG: right-handed parallel beta-helix repeat-containing protein [Methanomassiliicoccales archaeon]